MDEKALAWQVGVWDGISEIYLREIDRRFAPVVDAVITRARLTPGERVLDLGTGTGAVAERAAEVVGPGGHVLVETEVLGFEIDSFTEAWAVLARVTTAHLAPELQAAAKEAVLTAMYPGGDGPRHFRNVTQFIVGLAGKVS